MSSEQTIEVLAAQVEELKKENEQLRKQLSDLQSKDVDEKSVSFKEKYAVKILDSLPDMLTVFSHDEVGVEVVSNEETNHVGVSNRDFEGMRMCEMVPPEAYQNIHANMQKVIRTGTVSAANHELVFNGSRHHYENRIFPLDEEYVLIMCRDVTERVATQSRLEVFKSVLDKVSDSILAVSADDGTLVYANKQFIEEYNVTQKMGTQKIYDLRVSMHTPELWESRLRQIREHDGNLSYRAAYVRSGEVKERVHQVSTYLMKEDGQELVWFFTQDITDVIKKRDELRELNLLLEGILNNIPVYLYVKDPEDDFRYLYWNKAFAEHSKIPASKAIGRTDFEIFMEREDADKFRRDDLELLRTHERIDMQETYVSATGETRIVQTLKALVPMEGREPLLIGISWDITNFQNIEQELIKARIKAEQSDRLKTAFLANMSHEIRTPLNAIVGFSKLLPSAENEEEEKLYSDIINQNSDILLQLINDILDLSKIEAGTLEYVKRPMNVGEACRNILAVHKERVKEGVTLLLDNEQDLIIEEDQNRLSQIITNFITNAIKFTYGGEIHLGFKVEPERLYFYVKDTGIGIEPEKVDHIFDRFVKLNSFAQGTGLGLAICRMIVEKIGGEIGVTSELGKGSTFYFTIPFKGESNKCVGLPHAAESEYKSYAVKRMQQLKKILVAEDVDSNFILLKNMIGGNYVLLWAKDGYEAVEMYKRDQPDLILMDIKMPRMDGLEATRIIRSYSNEIPIIALTAYAFEADRERALEAGCNDFVTKPVSEEMLEKALGKFK